MIFVFRSCSFFVISAAVSSFAAVVMKLFRHVFPIILVVFRGSFFWAISCCFRSCFVCVFSQLFFRGYIPNQNKKNHTTTRKNKPRLTIGRSAVLSAAVCCSRSCFYLNSIQLKSCFASFVSHSTFKCGSPSAQTVGQSGVLAAAGGQVMLACLVISIMGLLRKLLFFMLAWHVQCWPAVF